MAQATDGGSEYVEAVSFGFLTDEEVRKHSVVKVTNTVLLDNVERPVAGGLYDPAMGTLDERTACKSCGQRSLNCPGHCGHIDLVSPVYNPLLFNLLYNLLKRTCFFCFHFRESRSQVDACVSKLELIAKGDVASAKELDFKWATSSSLVEANNAGDILSLPVNSELQHDSSTHQKQGEWTSLQFNEAVSVLNKFLKPMHKKCKNCKAKSPAISKPTFGWFHMSGMTGAQTRGNIIRGNKLDGQFLDGVGKENLSEMENIEGVALQNDGGNEAETPSSTFASPDSIGIAKKGHKRRGQSLSDEYIRQKNFFSGPLLPSEVNEIMRLLWDNEARLCSFISDIQQQGSGNKATHSMFFLGTVLVPPIKFRPPSKGGDSVMEHPHTVLLGKVLQANISLGNAHINQSQRATIISRWMDLQQSINVLFDSKTATGQGQRDVASGICQLLEKKEGMFRQNMMGKRVNYACRSVISPDPYLAVNEIGIPPYFALRLTYPERVTPWNTFSLRKAIINGTEIHPGATHYIDKLSTLKLPPARKGRISISRRLPSSRGVVTQTGKSSDNEFEGKIIYRHLRDGDIVLVNRQPTLHKPSIMAHVVRVLKGEKTLRMHYANCSTYNADFDGDEMNVHFPQDDISRAEAYNIVNANNQYVKPTNGSPIRALIQDHIVSAAILTKKDTFLNYDEFNHLLYSSGVSAAGSGSLRKLGKKVAIDFEENMLCPVPTIWKPEPLWTGKQLIATVLDHLTRGYPPFTVEKRGKIPSAFFKTKLGRKIVRSEPGKDDAIKHKPSKRKGTDKDKVKEQDKPRDFIRDKMKRNEEPGEDTVLIFKNYLICGVIDKAQFGDYGLVHTVQELYGSNTAGILLSAFSRLFTAFLQMHGFTCGVDDLLLSKDVDEKRQQQLEECERCGEEVHREVVGVKNNSAELQWKIEEVIRGNGDSALTNLDRRMISRLNELSSKKIEKNLLSEGLFKPTAKNCISLMTTSGAKGGTANFQQISSHLGQQELEGRRVPRMVSGKTLPCFPPWDWASRAGGFIIDRFLTGLRPQEYYFHCMAGREGLVDTAVKTSRSGYLQRCLVKNLECLKVSYDHTVRDADGSIVQFYYGEDGIDVHQTSFVAKFDALLANHDIMKAKYSTELRKSNSYITDLPAALKDKANKFMCDRNLSVPGLAKNMMLKPEDFVKSVEQKYFSSLAQPGEPVGVVAAQSVGEPSTQMTLNTFHHAGRGEMNVTLGIPRLQEILMTASTDIKTPILTCPLRRGRPKDDATSLAEKLKKITVAERIESMEVAVVPFEVDNHNRQVYRRYKLKMKLNRTKFCSLEHCEEILTVVYLRELEDAIQNHVLLLSKISGIKNFTSDSRPKTSSETDEDASGLASEHAEERNLDDDADDDDDDGNDNDDLGFDGQKRKEQATDEMYYEDGYEEERNELELSAGLESDADQANEFDSGKDEDGMPGIAPEIVSPSKTKKTKKKAKSNNKRKNRFIPKDFDRAIFVAANGLDFEVHFRFTNEPHILLAQIAQKVAKKVYLRSSGKIESCQVISCKENQVIYYGEDPKRRQKIEAEEKDAIPALHTNGADFRAFWQMQDELDIRYIYSNDIHAMLTTYGVEAARETIIREVQNVFGSYGISVDIRHLTLIADFMTHTGGYRPMNRLGGIAESLSPFSKMSFETASKFIVDAAYHGVVDKLETPSARICLGLPVKMGTGSFDLLQKLQL
ncbi:DNA-directed RNA polymerase I subunit 1 isoform X2 [Rhodamnia argentea]|uniref:DNA-directed RNA polymerase subunit n=1 Tax=Rhodamnia argentea TaxID=178133 RepID=A0ABM3HPY5_9MYRT|nr:DNA-directed RNA polymerase I subunit 1 isoform X2 [Rhodamnia argentea]